MATDRLHYAKSDIGRKRPQNEDCFLADSSLGLYIVCDGMGGGNAGEVASRMAIETIAAHIQSPVGTGAVEAERDDPNLTAAANQLAHAVRAANAAVFQASWEQANYAGMGTTVAAARLSGHSLSIAHVGDSRVYLVRNGAIQALTADHTWVAEQVAQGHMTEEEAERSPRRNIVTRALGVESTVDIDVTEIPVFRGDMLLLCSDGLTRGVRCRDILKTLEEKIGLEEKTDRLISLANEAGGEDNITVMLITIGGGATARLWQRLTGGWFLKAS
ncbi:MAG TPA: Stp1/IreP family PP2C-type Ser/Thr phosphatase [Nitrospira sp.]|nr:Stp1/IreP family PP2C-type Ser/Thr phosphatase [Nitrospira sp.]